MTSSESAARDLLNAISDNPLSFTWEDDTYDGLRGQLSKKKSYGGGGFLDEPDLRLITTRQKLNGAGALVARFPDDVIPEVGQKVTIDDVEYRIESMELDEYDSGLMMDLGTPHKGGHA